MVTLSQPEIKERTEYTTTSFQSAYKEWEQQFDVPSTYKESIVDFFGDRTSDVIFETIDEWLIKKLRVAFLDIEEVDSIYLEKSEPEILVTVLLSNQTYDDELMDRLLDREFDLQEQISNIYLDIYYVPLLERESKDCVSKYAKLVYRKME